MIAKHQDSESRSRESRVKTQGQPRDVVIYAFPRLHFQSLRFGLPPADCRQHAARGLTLLEVILSLAILAGSVAVLGELMRTGMLSASDARDTTRAEIYASSIMSQVVAGALPLSSVSNASVSDDPNFVYSMTTGPVSAGQQGLLQVQVTVTRAIAPQKRPVEFSLTRWIVDPEMEFNLASQAQANTDAAAQEKAAQEQQQQQNSSRNLSPQ
ncbi:MAG: hypothetical protein IT427_18845 [Pirellulales bacterium]|nr:hypothetical protein [Pirellulales bacterium]